jgi:hypothetical protein
LAAWHSPLLSGIATREITATRSPLEKLHSDAFGQWLAQSLDQKARDFAGYLATPEGRAAYLSFERRELVRILTPSNGQAPEVQRFNSDLAAVILALSHRPASDPVAQAPQRVEYDQVALLSSGSQNSIHDIALPTPIGRLA